MDVPVKKIENVEDIHSESAGSIDIHANGGATPKVHFRLWPALGMNFSVTATPVSIGAYLSLVIGLGGFPYFFWCFVFAGFFQLVLGLVLAELASAIPHSSGPAYWMRVLSPVKYARFLEYLVGWLTIALWGFVATGESLFLAQWSTGFAEAMNPGYRATPWQVYLISDAFALICLILNLPGFFKIVPYIMTSAVVFINITWIYMFIAMLVRATPKASAETVFVDIVNETGWSSDGLVFFLAFLPALISVSGFDSCMHIADEVPAPDKDIPQVIIGSAFLSYTTGLAMIIMFGFCTVNPAGIFEPYGHQPLLNVLKDGLRSDALFCVATTAIIMTYFVSALAVTTSWSRLYWSFARSNGLPFSSFATKLTSKEGIPVNALLVNFGIVAILNTIGIGSLTALNSIFGSAVVFGLVSFFLGLLMAIWRGRAFLNDSRWLNLGRWGLPLQVIALVWCAFVTVWLCFPLYLPVTPDTMNWTVVIVLGVVVLATVYYVAFGKHIKAREFYG